MFGVCVCVLFFFHSKPLLRTSQLCTGKRAQTSVICTYAEINECIGFNDRCSAVAFHVSPPSGAFILINGAPESDFMCASRPPPHLPLVVCLLPTECNAAIYNCACPTTTDFSVRYSLDLFV